MFHRTPPSAGPRRILTDVRNIFWRSYGCELISCGTSTGKAAGKTAKLREQLAKLGAENALIIGGAELDASFVKAARNIPLVDVLPQQGINVYDILRRDVLVLSKDAAAHLEERLK